MTPERWRQIEQLFHEVLSCEPAQRNEFLASRCADDDALRLEVESLLSAHDTAHTFIETPPGDLAAELLGQNRTALRPGDSIGDYLIERKLNSGGMGEVYLAYDTRLSRRIALKLLPRYATIDADRVKRFEREARAASALNHPNIVTIHDIRESKSGHFITTEFIDGKTLRQYMHENELSLYRALDLAIQAAGALVAAHDAGIVHRDVKPENIMIRHDDCVKILDFGLAKLVRQRDESPRGRRHETVEDYQTAKGLILGTVNYMSPEQAKGEHVDERSDIFSLGVVFYEMVSGRTPFAADLMADTLANVVHAEPSPLTGPSGKLQHKLNAIVTMTLHKDPRQRYQTMKDLRSALVELRDNLNSEQKPKVANESREMLSVTDVHISKPANAYQAYQLSRYHFHRVTFPDLAKSRLRLEESLRMDPAFAPAHAALAEQSVMEAITGLQSPAAAFPKARVALRRAFDLKLDSAELHAVAGWVALVCNWNFDKAVRDLKQSLQLNSHHAFAHVYLGQVYLFQKRFADAENCLLRAQEIEPTSLHNRIILTISYFLTRSYQKVLHECDKLLAIDPGFLVAKGFRCLALEQMGSAAEAIIEYEQILREPGGEIARRWLGYAYALAGDREKALHTVAQLDDERREHYLSPTHQAMVYAALKDADKAISYLEKALAQRDPWMLWIAADPRCDNVRSDSRFDRLVEQIGFK